MRLRPETEWISFQKAHVIEDDDGNVVCVVNGGIGEKALEIAEELVDLWNEEHPPLRFEEIRRRSTDLMTLEEWLECCEDELLIDDDGWGYLATKTKESNISISPSDRHHFDFPEWATHICWYNK